MSSENADPSKMSLKDRIKFFASKAKENATQGAAAGKPLSPTRAALLEGSAVGRARGFAGSVVVEAGAAGAASRLGVRVMGGGAPPPALAAAAAAPPAAAPADAELAEALAAPPPPAAATVVPPLPPPPRTRVVLPPCGGGTRTLGLRLTRAGPRESVVVAGVDPAGAAAGAGVTEGSVFTALLIEGAASPLWGSDEACEEEALRARLDSALAAGGAFSGVGIVAEFEKV